MEPRPYRQKPSPEKFCAYCGTKLERKRFSTGRLEDLGVFKRRKFCNQSCMAKDFDTRHRENLGWMAAHHQARQIVGPKTECVVCASTRSLDVHHRDGNFQNNSPDNLIVLCRSCHLKVHHKRK
jgi:5-methylcytosine-specific restriction endonuclease McrA